jgi:hypothetical protein
MSENAEYLKCPCDHCSQKLEFPAEGVGAEVQCPACGMTTRLHRPAYIPLPPTIQMRQATVPEREKKKAKFAGSDSLPMKRWTRLGWLVSVKMAVALVVACSLIYAVLKPKEITISGQVFIVTKRAENIKLGAVEVSLIEKKRVTEFLRARQAAIESEIDIRQIALATAKKELALITNNDEYVKIESQLDALTRTNSSLIEKEKQLERQLEALGVFYILTDPFGDRAVPGYPRNPDAFQISRLREDGVDLAKARPLFKQLAEVLNALHQPGQIENAADQEKALLRQLKEIQQRGESKVANLRKSLDRFPTADDYLSGFCPVVLKKTITDADGRFSVSYPRNNAFTLFARAQRTVINGTEKYCWLVDAPTIPETAQVFLSNNNLAPVDPDHYFKLKPKEAE